jgi:hypothetical protein
MDPTVQWLWDANLVALAVLLVRLALARLYKIYPFMFLYFLVMSSGSMALTRIPLRSNLYSYSYMAVEVSMHMIGILTVLEMYKVALARHRGLASFGRASVLTVTLGTILVAAVGTLLDLNVLKGQSAINHRFFTLERTMDFVIFIFLLLIVIFVTWFPVELARNVAVSMGGYAVYCFARVTALLAINLLPPQYDLTINRAALGASLAIFAIWFVALRRDGLRADSVVGHAWDPAALSRVSRQLDAINAALVRFGRR